MLDTEMHNLQGLRQEICAVDRMSAVIYSI
jgi:hypothetical protein